MARILITGSSDGLGALAAKRLISTGNQVVLHARNEQRARDALANCEGAETVVTGDLSSLAETKKLAEQVNKLGTFDCIIHNAGLYQGGYRKTANGLPALAAVNTVAPYVLANLINKPKRMVFVSSELHQNGSSTSLQDPLWQQRGEAGWSDMTAYCDSKLHNVMFAKWFARRWPDVQVNSLDPGWVATKMGGSSATDDADKAVDTYAMLAEGKTEKSGRYFRPGGKEGKPHKDADDEGLQNKLIKACEDLSGVKTA
jgi:NAD(P)-dependent dehydrogenase (short-subunit alcohol dehydrogenase family)